MWPAVALLALALPAPVLACSPEFPPSMLLESDSKAFPTARFEAELNSLLASLPTPDATPAHDASPVTIATGATDIATMRAALGQHHVNASELARLMQGVLAVRMAVDAHERLLEDWRRRRPVTARPPLSTPPIPPGLPAEFRDYLHGAVLYHDGQMEDARRAWDAVLALPERDRRHRSTWAEYMLGRSRVDDEPAQAIEDFRKLRALCDAGFEDPLHLAAESLGWEARARSRSGDVAGALALYLRQRQAGDEGALISLRWTATGALKLDRDALARAAADPVARRLVTAAAFGGCLENPKTLPGVKNWLAALERTAASDMAEADRFAWLAYESGDFDQAGRWLALAPATPEARWLKSRLLARDGKLEDATAELAAAVADLRADTTWLAGTCTHGNYGIDPANARATGELGKLRLSHDDFVDALDALLDGGYWTDAAYLAERVLTVDELLAYVVTPGCERASRAGALRRSDDETGATKSWLPGLRNLVARRLTRLGRFEEARAFAAEPAVLDDYAAALRTGHDASRPRAERARALWSVARLAREHGMTLLATEVEPDWAEEGGYFDRGSVGDARARDATPSERERTESSGPAHFTRYHYRYVAADIAWEAARLLPPGDEAADILWRAGRWLATLDPPAANRFYRALATRCKATRLGAEAARLHWFPAPEG